MRRTWLVLAAMVVGAAGLHTGVVLAVADSGSASPTPWHGAVVLALLVGFAVAEVAVVHVPRGRTTYTLTLSDTPLVLGLFVLGPLSLVLVRVLGAAVPLAMRNRASPRKLLFNLTWFWIEACVAVLLWAAVTGGDSSPRPVTWLAAGLVTVVTDLLGTLLIAVVVAVDSGDRGRVREMLGEARPLAAVVNASAALVMVYVLTVDWRALWTVVVVVAVLVFAQSAHNRLRRRTESLEQLSLFTGEIGGQVDVESAARTALAWIARELKAEVAELELSAGFAGTAQRWVAGYDGTVTEHSGHGLARAFSPWVRRDPLLVRRGSKERGIAEAMSSAGLRDVVVMPLLGDGDQIGTLLVGDRLGDVETFAGSDLRELVSLGNHLAVTLRNARRADQIREQAEESVRRSLHDELTGLPNRRCLEDRVALLRDGAGATALVLDLDRFKDINSTLGHKVGDMLLCQVAERLRQSMPEDALVARLGGDEYAVLLPTRDSATTASVVAMVRHVFTTPFVLENLEVTVEASIGVADDGGMSDVPSAEVDVLRRADIAMSEAKVRRTGVEPYTSAMEVGSPQRLTLLTDLRRAIGQGELAVFFQPQVRVSDGRVVGAEALVRWLHPARGVIGPDEFVPVAEHSGLITPLTSFVLRQALDACARWRRQGHGLGISVNISPRSLLEPSFVDEVARAVAAVEVPASAVTLEVTESSLMADPERAVEALHRLRSLGVRLSIDDLGTGYSSLAYLQRLPAAEVKIDKSFLLDGDEGDGYAVVGAVVDLGHRLGREVVAEGVEHVEAWERLQQLGCDVAQGFWLSRPLPQAEFDAWLGSWVPRSVARLRAIS